MKKANMLVTAMSKNDVIATSSIDHTKYDHYVVGQIDWNSDYEYGLIFKWNSDIPAFKYNGDYFDDINIPNAVQGGCYVKVNGKWIKCEVNHDYR